MKLLTKLSVPLLTIFFIGQISVAHAQKATQQEIAALNTADMNLAKAQVSYMNSLDLLVFEMQVEGQAGNTTPEPAGQMNGAPVLGYVFPTTLSPTDVGFGDVEGGLAVKQFRREDQSVMLPPTNPGMPMYLDSPGFSVVFRGNTLKVAVPAQRVNNRKAFNYDGVAAYMEVSTEENQPMLGVYSVYEVLSGDLSLPYKVKR